MNAAERLRLESQLRGEVADAPEAEAAPMVTHGHAALAAYLDRIIEHPEHRQEITIEIMKTFGQECAVMILDMSGFSRTTQRYGIVSFLLMIHQTRLLASPCVQSHRGRIVKAEADNLFCTFPAVMDAIAAAREIEARLRAANCILPVDRRLYVSCGIGFGHILNIGDQDFFGDEVNLASKLGEDVGKMGDILLTPNAYAEVREETIPIKEGQVNVSGLSFPFYSVEDHAVEQPR